MKIPYNFFSYLVPFCGNKYVTEYMDEILIKNNLLNPNQKGAEQQD